MNQTKPLVSVLLPVYNGQEFLSEALQSVLSQKYGNLEVIAVDDDSKDHSVRVLKKFKESDNRLRIYRNKNHYGLNISLNRALSKARGQFIAFMPQDGRNYVERIGKQVSFLLKNPSFGAVGTQVSFTKSNKVVSRSSFPINPSDIEKNLIGNALDFETFMINKLSLPRDILRFGQEEHPFLFSALFMKIIKYSTIANLEHVLIFKRLGSEENKTSNIELFMKNIRMFINSFFVHEYRPSIRSLFSL